MLHHLPIYPTIIERMKNHGSTFLDVGVALGQDLRRLVADGVPSEQTYGLDIDTALMDLGYTLFRDRATLQTTFVDGDIFAESQIPEWDTKLRGCMDIINASGFFMLFDDWNSQQNAACVLARLSRPVKGSLIVGRQAGALEAQLSRGIWEGSTTFFHNSRSWESFWMEVGELTGTQWTVRAWVDDVAVQGLGRKDGHEQQPYHFDKKRRLVFEVERL